MANDWEPIKTAPEGVLIWVRTAHDVLSLIRHGEEWRFPDGTVADVKPTHWKALDRAIGTGGGGSGAVR